MSKLPKRGDIFWVNFDPTVGCEINKKRPCLIISNDVANEVSLRVIVAPITSSATHVYPFEVKVATQENESKILLDQLRSVDKQRLFSKILSLKRETMQQVDKALS